MQTILYQGKPEEGGQWALIPTSFVSDFRQLGYHTRELVTRGEAEAEKRDAYNAGIERVAVLVEVKNVALARMVRDLKMPALVKAG